MKKVFILALSVLAFSCSNADKDASQLLEQANAAYLSKDYNTAKVLIDSINENFSKCFEVRKSGQMLSYQIDLAIEEGNKLMTDSLLEALIPIINETAEKYFVFEKSEYDELGRYIFKGTEVEKNVQRSYIHAAVDEYGVTQLISTYSGSKNINHTALKITASDGSSIVTATIPYNDGSNYKYEINGTKYESVTYKGEKDNGALGFIASHASDKNLKATLIAENKEYPVSLSKKEVDALCASYELGVILSNQLSYTQQNKVAEGKIKYLREKIASKTVKTEN